MLKSDFYKKFKQLSIALTAFGLSSLSLANDFQYHPSYAAFKQNAMQSYGLSAQQVDSAMSGTRNLPNIINIMNRPGESKPWY